jgi:hypothetical protein
LNAPISGCGTSCVLRSRCQCGAPPHSLSVESSAGATATPFVLGGYPDNDNGLLPSTLSGPDGSRFKPRRGKPARMLRDFESRSDSRADWPRPASCRAGSRTGRGCDLDRELGLALVHA